MITKFKNFAYALMLIFFSVELTSWTALALTGLLPSQSFQTEYLNDKKKDIGVKFKNEDVGWAKLRPHPYFGYVLAQGNNHGFVNDSDFPYIKKDNEFVVGIFGGSVAWDLGMKKNGQYLAQKLKQEVSQLRDKKVVVLNLAMGAHKQPQAFFISTFYANMFDLLINVEGYNEIMPRSSHQMTRQFNTSLSESLPAFTEFLYNYNQESLGEVGQSLYAHNLKKKVADFFTDSWFNKSASAYLLYSAMGVSLEWLKYKSINKDQAYIDQKLDEYSDNKIQSRVEDWSYYACAQSAALSSLNKKHIIFIQPTLNNSRSKAEAPAEKIYIFKDHNTYVTKAYKELLVKVSDLQKLGVPVFDLSSILASDDRHLYRDPVHFNDLGNRVLLNAIVREILKHDLLSSLPN